MTFRLSFLYIALLLIVHQLATVFDWYWYIRWFDVPMHFFGGFAVGAFALALWNEGIEEVRFKGWMERHLKWWLVPLFVLSFTSLIGIIWEVHEFVLDAMLAVDEGQIVGVLRQPDVADTMLDFVLDLAGASLAVLVHHRMK